MCILLTVLQLLSNSMSYHCHVTLDSAHERVAILKVSVVNKIHANMKVARLTGLFSEYIA